MLSGISLLSLFTAGFRNNLKYMVAGLLLESGYFCYIKIYIADMTIRDNCTYALDNCLS